MAEAAGTACEGLMPIITRRAMAAGPINVIAIMYVVANFPLDGMVTRILCAYSVMEGAALRDERAGFYVYYYDFLRTRLFVSIIGFRFFGDDSSGVDGVDDNGRVGSYLYRIVYEYVGYCLGLYFVDLAGCLRDLDLGLDRCLVDVPRLETIARLMRDLSVEGADEYMLDERRGSYYLALRRIFGIRNVLGTMLELLNFFFYLGHF